MFATRIVNHGLPIHIGAAVLGHLDVHTTHGNVAVFQDSFTHSADFRIEDA